MPDRITITRTGWKDSPWEFTRPTASGKFGNVGSGQDARVRCDYEPVRAIVSGDTATSEGITQGQTFMLTIYWD